MVTKSQFEEAVAAGKPTGEVVAIDRFIVKVKGLRGVSIGSLVIFETGQIGMVREVEREHTRILNIDREPPEVGGICVAEAKELMIPVGEALIGRVVDPFGRPLDGKGPIQLTESRPAFFSAPSVTARSILKDQLPSGVSIVDTLFPIVLGQRIAVLGDAKSGKTSFLLQLGAQQNGTGRTVVYVLIGKRRVEIDQTINILQQSGAMEHSIVVVANIFDSLAKSYIAPYAACAMAEHLWYGGKDTVIVYDDLASHAKVYREISLLENVNPGRESYPGDMFYAHSSLLERAGKLAENGKTLTALPVVITPGDDITAYLPTSIMSITDGQIIFDLSHFRQNIRPAVNIGLSVSRVGGRAQNTRQKAMNGTLFKLLAEYKQTSEFASFASEMSAESKNLLTLGKQIYDAFRQSPTERLSLDEQLLLFETLLRGNGGVTVDIAKLKTRVHELVSQNAANTEETQDGLLREVTIGNVS